MKLKTILLILVSVFLFVQCSSKTEKPEEKVLSKEQMDKSLENPDPDTAEAILLVKKVTENDNGFILDSEVQSAGKFGRGTPRIGTGKAITVFLAKNLGEKPAVGSELSTVLKHSAALGGAPEWSIITLK